MWGLCAILGGFVEEENMSLEQCVAKVLVDLLEDEGDTFFQKVKSRIETVMSIQGAVRNLDELPDEQRLELIEAAYQSVRATLNKI